MYSSFLLWCTLVFQCGVGCERYPPSEAQLGAGVVSVALVPAQVADWEEETVLRHADEQRAVLSKPHWWKEGSSDVGETDKTGALRLTVSITVTPP